MAKCKNCNNLYNLSNEDDEIVGKWCPKINDSPDIELERECEHYKCITNADRIRSMTDEELANILFCSCMDVMYGECVQTVQNDVSCSECVLKWLKSEVE